MTIRLLRQVLVAAALACGTTAQAQEAPTKEPRLPQNSQEYERVLVARRAGGIPAAAKLFGKYLGDESFGGIKIARDATTVAWQSDLVVLGRVLSAEAHLSPDQKRLSTEYKVQLDRVLKGGSDANVGAVVDVTLPGGKIIFEDGTSAETVARGLHHKMEVGRQYLLFLEQSEAEITSRLRSRVGPLGRFKIAYGPQGLFELKSMANSAKLEPCGDPKDAVGQELASVQSIEQIVSKVSSAVTASLSYPQRERKSPDARQP